MRTPFEVFEDMCPVHDQIWIYDGARWGCIRRSPEGERYKQPDSLVPLPVEEMAAITGLMWIYFCTITGHTEPLVSKEQKASLIATRTSEQNEREGVRLAEMEEDRKQHRDCFIEHIFDPYPSAPHVLVPPESHEETDQYKVN